jgi:N-acetylglutamate synthase
MIEIRFSKIEDISQLIELLKKSDLYLDSYDSPDCLKDKIGIQPDSVFVAVAEQRIIGMAITIWDPWGSSIYHWCVDPEYRGQGVGKRILEEAERYLKEKGARSISAYVYPDNEQSLSLFRQSGYGEFDLAVPLSKLLT